MTVRTLLSRILMRLVFPLLPAQNRLPFWYWTTCLNHSAEPELIHLEKLSPSDQRRTAVDIGANTGLYSYRFSQLFRHVYAFEINPAVLTHLQAFRPGNLEIFPCGLSSQESETTLHIPILRGVEQPGWASLSPNNHPDTQNHSLLSVRTRTLDSFALNDVSFMKIDVEGHESEVLLGARETIRRWRPRILTEVRDQTRPRVSSFLAEFDYVEVSLPDLLDEPASPGQVFYLPREQAASQ